MDDIKKIEDIVINEGAERDAAPPPSVPSNEQAQVATVNAPVSVALDKTAGNIVERAQERIDSGKIADKYSKRLAKNAEGRISNEIERQDVENERSKAANIADRKEIANRLYEIKENAKRLKAEQRHLSKMQRQQQKAEKARAYWEEHKATLEQYNMHEGSSRIACNILLWLDGVKCFFNGLSKVSDSIIKALKWILIIGAVTGALMAIPATRRIITNLLGY